jgi:hypothetical protein
VEVVPILLPTRLQCIPVLDLLLPTLVAVVLHHQAFRRPTRLRGYLAQGHLPPQGPPIQGFFGGGGVILALLTIAIIITVPVFLPVIVVAAI